MTYVDSTLPNAATSERSVRREGVSRIGFDIKKILVPTDLRKESQTALRHAIFLAKAFRARLTLLHVYQEPYALDYLRGPQACAAVIRHRRDAEDVLAALAAEVKENHVACNTDFRYGGLYEEITKAAEDCDLIVVSTHHYDWLGRVAYGSDSVSILRRAHCPVLVVGKSKPVADSVDHPASSTQ